MKVKVKEDSRKSIRKCEMVSGRIYVDTDGDYVVLVANPNYTGEYDEESCILVGFTPNKGMRTYQYKVGTERVYELPDDFTLELSN